LNLSKSRHLTVAASLDGAGFVTGEQWLEPVVAAERAGIDFVTLEGFAPAGARPRRKA
jgi:hypothetical protein